MVYCIATILVVWFKTNFIVEYGKIFGFKFAKFYETKDSYPKLLFADYIQSLGWFGRLFGCLYCFNIWITLLCSIPDLSQFCINYIWSLFLYLLLSFLSK